MSSADPGAPTVHPADVERWLADLGLEPVERADRDGITSWDLVLDGRRRFDLRVTVILDPSLALICWAHFAPPINDMFRKSYRKLLRWNDEFPFAKFSVGEDERPLLAVELPIGVLAAAAGASGAGGRSGNGDGADALGLALTRIVGIADRLFDDAKSWLWIGGHAPDQGHRTPRNADLLERFADRLPEIFEDAPAPGEADDTEAPV
ncbi:MAG: putative bacterial sensory transduction regulator [Chloroflexota bacterium]|jgi:hypothetical protein|nr:putative bacterial sensory transduction regulator [Chloroflexota bacterium]